MAVSEQRQTEVELLELRVREIRAKYDILYLERDLAGLEKLIQQGEYEQRINRD